MISLTNVTNNKGFTLIEALVAMVVLSIGIFSLYTLQVTSIQNNSKASNITIASNWGAEKIEEIISTPYEDLIDTDGDGTDQDADNNGIDDSNNDFGLNDITPADGPDGNETSPDGHFTVFWNVAPDMPLEGSTTIRIHVQDNNQKMKNPVTIQYVKEGPI
jgi:type IV pilus assembly protein PilV